MRRVAGAGAYAAVDGAGGWAPGVAEWMDEFYGAVAAAKVRPPPPRARGGGGREAGCCVACRRCECGIFTVLSPAPSTRCACAARVVHALWRPLYPLCVRGTSCSRTVARSQAAVIAGSVMGALALNRRARVSAARRAVAAARRALESGADIVVGAGVGGAAAAGLRAAGAWRGPLLLVAPAGGNIARLARADPPPPLSVCPGGGSDGGAAGTVGIVHGALDVRVVLADSLALLLRGGDGGGGGGGGRVARGAACEGALGPPGAAAAAAGAAASVRPLALAMRGGWYDAAAAVRAADGHAAIAAAIADVAAVRGGIAAAADAARARGRAVAASAHAAVAAAAAGGAAPRPPAAADAGGAAAGRSAAPASAPPAGMGECITVSAPPAPALGPAAGMGECITVSAAAATGECVAASGVCAPSLLVLEDESHELSAAACGAIAAAARVVHAGLPLSWPLPRVGADTGAGSSAVGGGGPGAAASGAATAQVAGAGAPASVPSLSVCEVGAPAAAEAAPVLRAAAGSDATHAPFVATLAGRRALVVEPWASLRWAWWAGVVAVIFWGYVERAWGRITDRVRDRLGLGDDSEFGRDGSREAWP